MSPSRTIGLALVGLGLALAQHAVLADTTNDRAERARIERERRAIEQTFTDKERECRQRFVVTACVDAAQGERREALKPLRVQQQLLDEAQRRERAAQRLESIRQKESGADAKQREAMARQQQKVLPGPSAASDAPTVKPPATRLPRAPAAALPRTSAASAAERSSERAERQDAVAEHREAVAKRRDERLAKGKKSVPLPIPGVIPPAASR